MSKPDRFSDGQYKNWLKCSQSLIIMKEALHDYIDKEVTKLHGDITLKVSSIPCGSSTGNQCGSCSWKNIKLTRVKPGTWSINCKNSICDKWLHQILAVHDDPHNPTLNWKNAVISKWPTDCYHVAKIFMPKGQDKTTKMPEDLDAPAILSLMKYCNWFRKDLPNSQILSDLIEIRNKVLHSGDLRIIDGDKDSWIDLMIQLLNELNIHGDACIELKKLKTDDIDINFRETEIRVLQKMVSDLVSDLTKVKRDMVSLQNFQSDLSEEMEKLRDNTAETTGKVDTVEADTEGMRKALEELKNIADKMVTFFDKNPDILDINITETIRNIDRDVQDQQRNLFRVETELKVRVSSLEVQMEKHQEETKQQIDIYQEETKQQIDKHQEETKQQIDIHQEETKQQIDKHQEETNQQIDKHQDETKQQIDKHQEETKQQIEETKKQVEGLERRIFAVEERKENNEQLSLQRADPTKRRQESYGLKQLKKDPRKRRPESDELKQLKNQAEDKLDTLRRLECIPTKKAEEAKKLLEGKRSIVIKGNPGEGKTTMALHLIDNEIYRDKRVVLNYPRHWEKVDTDWVDIVVLEDVFGQFDLDLGRLQDWMVYLPTIQEHVDAGKLWVIVTTRVDILSKAYSKVGSLKLFSDDLSLTLSSDQLKHSEKMSILNRELHRHERNMKEDEKEQCISNFIGLIGFPQCCSLFAGDIKLFDRGPEFFGSPNKFFVANITGLEATRFLSLAFLFCNGKIWEENLSLETMPDSSKHLLMELASHLHISEKEASITLLRDAYENFLELYIMKSMSNNFSLESVVTKSCIQFTHATVCEAVGHVLGDRCLEMVVKYGDSEYLYQRTYTARAKDVNFQNVFIPVSMYGLLAERMVHDVVKRGLVRSVVKHSALKQHDFLMKLKCELHNIIGIKDFVMAVPYSVSIFSKDLSQGMCNTFMQYMLQSDENVMRLVYSEFLEFLACAHNNNSSDCWQCEEKQKVLELALYYQHFQMADKLITMKACYTHVSLCNAARHGNLRRVQTILGTLKRSQVFNPECKEAKCALHRSYTSGNQRLIELLLKEGVILDSWHVVDAVQDGLNVLMNVVEHLKCHNKWNPHLEQQKTLWDILSLTQWTLFSPSVYLDTTKLGLQFKNPCSTALYITYCNEKFDMADYLLKNEVKVSSYLLLYMSQYSSQMAVARLIQNLKDTGTWDPHCDDASKALEKAYSQQKYDVCDLLVQEGVSLTMENLPCVVYSVSLETVKKAIQHLKETGKWNPKCDDSTEALGYAYNKQKYDVCDLLIQEGVSLTMEHIPDVILRSLDCVKTAVRQLKDIDNWDPKCDDASEALASAYSQQKYEVCDLLVQEGVSLTMKNLCYMLIFWYVVSLESVKKAIQHLKDSDNWDPKCEDASVALGIAYITQNYDVYDLLVQEGISLTMKNLPGVVYSGSLETVKNAIENLKDTGNWDPKWDDASGVLASAYSLQKYDVCDFLVQEGVSLTMKNLPDVVFNLHASLETVNKAIQHLKDTVSWDPKCDYASVALAKARLVQKFDVCDLLVKEGVSPTVREGVLSSSGTEITILF